MSEYVLGLDIGTSAVKAVLCNDKGYVVDEESRSYGASHPHPRFAEQDANDWWRASVESIQAITSRQAKDINVRAISLSTQGGTLVPTTASGEPLSPAVLWHDKRCVDEAAYMRGHELEKYIYEKSGWLLTEGLNLLQIMWMKKHRPELFQKTELFLSVPDFMALKMTGKAVIDPSNAGINQLSDIRKLTWDDSLLKLAGIQSKHLPILVQSGEIIGHLTPEVATLLGLSVDTKLIAGGHDQYCVSLGLGAVSPGDSIIGTGTAWVVVSIGNSPQYDMMHGVAVSRHVLNDMWGALFSLEMGGSSLAWWRDLAFTGEDIPSYAAIDETLSRRNINENLFFYPHLTGAKYPQQKPGINGAFIGLTPDCDAYDLSAAVMEGVTYQSIWQMDTLNLTDEGAMYMSGGAAKSKYWSQIVADILCRPLFIPKYRDAGAYGAALLAGLSIGLYDGAEQLSQMIKDDAERVMPSGHADIRRLKYDVYKKNAHRLMEFE